MHLAIGLYQVFQINFGLMSPGCPAESVWVDTVSHSTVSISRWRKYYWCLSILPASISTAKSSHLSSERVLSVKVEIEASRLCCRFPPLMHCD